MTAKEIETIWDMKRIDSARGGQPVDIRRRPTGGYPAAGRRRLTALLDL